MSNFRFRKLNVVILRVRIMPSFSKHGRHLFSRGRMDTRVSALESPMSQLSQEFLFVFIAPLKFFSQPLEVESFRYFEAEMTEYST